MNHLGKIASFERNPREPGTNSFEKIQFSYLNDFPTDNMVDSNHEDEKILDGNKQTISTRSLDFKTVSNGTGTFTGTPCHVNDLKLPLKLM